MTKKEIFITEVEAYLRSTGISESKFGLAVANDAHLMKRIRSGGISMVKAAEVEKYIADNPPKSGEANAA